MVYLATSFSTLKLFLYYYTVIAIILISWERAHILE